MVTTVTSYTEVRNLALIADGYDGVVRGVVGNMYGTGVLLFDGKAVLTAAHLFNGSAGTAKVAQYREFLIFIISQFPLGRTPSCRLVRT